MISHRPTKQEREQELLWADVRSATITRWSGLDESAGPDEDVVFLDATTSPFRQLGQLQAHLSSGRAIDFGHVQDTQSFGLWLEPEVTELRPTSPWLRTSPLDDLPTGKVERLNVHLDARSRERTIVEAEFVIAGRPLLIVAAEVEPSESRTSRLRWGDECLFVFVDPAAADGLSWDARSFTSVAIPPAR